MKYYLTALVALFCMVGVNAYAVEAPEAAEQAVEAVAAVEPAAEAVAAMEQSGSVVSFDAEAKTVTVSCAAKEEGQTAEEVTFGVEDTTLIKKADEVVDSSALAAGEQVSVEYTVNDEGNKVASSIEISNQE